MARGSRFRLPLVVGLLGAAALALGLWDALVERDGGPAAIWGIVFPLLIIASAVLLARRGRREPPGG